MPDPTQLPDVYTKSIAELRAVIPSDVRATAAPMVAAIIKGMPDVAPATIARSVFAVCGVAAQMTGESVPTGTLAMAVFLATQLAEPVEPVDGMARVLGERLATGKIDAETYNLLMEQHLAAKASEAEPLIDPDCRDGKCGSCVGGPCQHPCHTEAATSG